MTAGRCEKIDEGDDSRADDVDDGGIDRIVKIGLLNCLIALQNAAAVALPHEAFTAERMNRPDAVDRFGNHCRDTSLRRAVVDLCAEHAFLHSPRENENERQDQNQHKRKPFAAQGNHDKQTDDLAQIREHADDAGSKKLFHRIDIADEAGGGDAGLCFDKTISGKLPQLRAKSAAQGVRDLLTENDQQALASAFKHAADQNQAEIGENHQQRDILRTAQTVHNAAQNDRRDQRGDDGYGGRKKNQSGKKEMPPDGQPDDFTAAHGRFLLPAASRVCRTLRIAFEARHSNL